MKKKNLQSDILRLHELYRQRTLLSKISALRLEVKNERRAKTFSRTKLEKRDWLRFTAPVKGKITSILRYPFGFF